MSDSLIDVDTFYKTFFHKGKYIYGGGWPNSTTLLYRIRIAGLSKENELLYKMGCLSLQCERWRRLDNAPKQHAEIKLNEQVEELIQHLCEGNGYKHIGIDIVLNNSPCANCADQLITLKQTIESKPDLPAFCDMNIKFARFYEHYTEKNVRALINMTRHQIQLTVFNGLCDWKEFLDNTVNLNLDIQSERFFGNWPLQRETALVNSAILSCIKKAAFLWSTLKNQDQQTDYISKMSKIRHADDGLAVLKDMRARFPDKI